MNKNFDPQNVVLTFNVMSDVHVSGSWYQKESKEKLINGLEYARKVTGNPVDAYVFCGDFVDCMNSKANVLLGDGWGDDYETAKAEQSAREFETLRYAFQNHIPEEAEIIYCLGNHDSTNRNNIDRFIEEFSSLDEIGDGKYYDRMYRTDLDHESLKNGMRHCVCKGYHFLCIDVEDAEPDFNKTIEFLKKNLDEITAKEPDKYVFVVYHYKPVHTVFLSDTHHPTSARRIGNLLKNYPQVILLTGHNHTTVCNERAIMQDKYTVLECGCVSYVMPWWVFKEPNVEHSEHYELSEGMLFEIDKNGSVRITRLDYSNRKPIKGAWELPAPQADGSHLKVYTEDLKYTVRKPEFAKDAKIKIEETKPEGKTKITFSKALGDARDIFRYQIVVTDTNGNVSVHHPSSLFCYPNDSRHKEDTLELTIGQSYEYLYKIVITAQDFWFNDSDPLVYFHKI